MPTLNLSSGISLTVEVQSVIGERLLGAYGVAPILTFRIDPLNSSAQPPRVEQVPAVLTDITADVSVVGKGGRGRWGLATRASILLDEIRYRDVQVRLLLPLSAMQIQAADELRQGGDVDFDFAVNVLITVAGALQSGHVQLKYKMNQSSWVTLLGPDQMQYQELMLIEVPASLPSPASQTAQAIIHLAKAQDALRNWNADETILHCRRALEALATANNNPASGGRSIAECSGPDARKAAKETRLDAIRGLLWHFAGPSVHWDPEPVRIQLNKDDATFMVATTAALIRLCGQHPELLTLPLAPSAPSPAKATP